LKKLEEVISDCDNFFAMIICYEIDKDNDKKLKDETLKISELKIHFNYSFYTNC
jgi:hypothetical protein